MLLADGSSTIAPDTPAGRAAFGRPANQRPGCGFPVPKRLGLFDAFSGMVVGMPCLPPYAHEARHAVGLHPVLRPGDLLVGDLLVGDRGSCSYAHLALPTSRYVRRLGRQDQLVARVRPKQRPAWMGAAQFATLPAELLVREVRYPLKGRGRRTRVVTVATTPLDPAAYPKDKAAELYGVRWSVETHFLELKTTLRMRRVKSHTPDGVRKELAAYCLVYHLVRAAMVRAAERQGTTPDRVSFADAVRWLISAAAPGQGVAPLVLNPRRAGRHEPRVIKDLQDTYRKMVLPRAQTRRRPDLEKR